MANYPVLQYLSNTAIEVWRTLLTQGGPLIMDSTACCLQTAANTCVYLSAFAKLLMEYHAAPIITPPQSISKPNTELIPRENLPYLHEWQQKMRSLSRLQVCPVLDDMTEFEAMINLVLMGRRENTSCVTVITRDQVLGTALLGLKMKFQRDGKALEVLHLNAYGMPVQFQDPRSRPDAVDAGIGSAISSGRFRPVPGPVTGGGRYAVHPGSAEPSRRPEAGIGRFPYAGTNP